MEIMTYDHFYRITMILNPEQKKKFALIFQDIMKMVLPQLVPPPNPPPPPPPHEGPPLRKVPENESSCHGQNP
jgi:hypothetical protein